MAKRKVKYINVMSEVLGHEPKTRKSTMKYLSNMKKSKNPDIKVILGGPGSRKIRRNIIKAMPGYKNKYMQSSWSQHQVKTYGREKYNYLVECGKKKKDQCLKRITNYLRRKYMGYVC